MELHPRRPEPYRILVDHYLDNGQWAIAQPLVGEMEKQVNTGGYWPAYYRFFMAALQEQWEPALAHLQQAVAAGLNDRKMLEDKQQLSVCLARPEFRQWLDAHIPNEK